MKSLVLFVWVLSCFTNYAEAKFFSCKAVSFSLAKEKSDQRHSTIPMPRFLREKNSDAGGSVGAVVMDRMAALCQSNGQLYSFVYEGGGVALHYDNAYFTLSCPLIFKRRFDKENGAYFFGEKVSLQAGAGVTEGVFLNHALGTCILSGLTIGGGASVSLGLLHIEKVEAKRQIDDLDKKIFSESEKTKRRRLRHRVISSG